MRLVRFLLFTLVLSVLGAASASAQQRRLTGRVTAEDSNEPLASASIGVVGSNEGAITNEQGVFNIATTQQGALTLRVRRIGYQQRTVQVAAGQTEVNIQLVRDVLQLEGVVVTGQSTTLDRSNATTATAIVSGEEVTRAPARSLENALQGKIVGANINMNSGSPGGGGQIQIRGASSILGQGEPLIVVDGVLINNSSMSSGLNSITNAGGAAGTNLQGLQDNVVNRLADINPNEIESLEVLKSAAATALYGSRATNGVIVIRTKRGRAGEVRTNITQRVGTQDLLRGYGQRRYTSVDQAVATAADIGIDTAYVRSLGQDGSLPFHDFTDELYSNNDLSYETIVNVSGGTERTRFNVSGTNRKEQGIGINTGARLQALRLNLDQSIGSRLNFSVGLNATRNLLQRGISNNANDPNPSPVYLFGYTPSFINLDSVDALTGRYVRNPYNNGQSSNPFETFRQLRSDEDVSRYFGSANVTYTAFQSQQHKVDLALNAGVDRLSQEGGIYSPNFLQYEPVDAFPGTAVQSNTSGLNYNSGVNVTWLYSPAGGAFSLTTSVGAVQETQEQNSYFIRGRGLLPGIPRTDISSNTAVFQQFQNFRDQALLFNAQLLAFNERLSLNVGTRSDRSSANGDPEQFYTFPRASVSYQLRNLLPGVDVIKPRFGYGQTGNRPRYGDRDILLTNSLVDASRLGTIVNQTVGNRDIKPEALEELEFGADVTFLNQRLAFEGTFFDRTITDLLLQPAVAPSTGVTNLVINAGELQTRGLEFALNGQVVQTNDFQWTSRVTYQSTVQKLNNLPPQVPAFNAPNSFGASYGRNRFVPISGTRTTYIWGNVPLDADGNVLPVGAFLTDSNSIAGVRDTIIGDANPDFQMFFTNTLQYKRLGLSFLLDWRKGGDVSNMTNNLYDEGQQSRDYDDPSPVEGLTLGQYRYRAWAAGQDTRIYVQDGGFVKLREVALSYDIPEALLNRVGGARLSSLRVQLLGRNLVTWTDYWGAEPESSNFGSQNFNRFIDLAPYPPGRQYFLSFDLGF